MYEIVTPAVTPVEYCGTMPVSVVPVTVMLATVWLLNLHAFAVQVVSKLTPDSVNAVPPLSGAFIG